MENNENADRRKTLLSLMSNQDDVVKNLINAIFQRNQNGIYSSSIDNIENLPNLINYLIESEDEEVKLQILYLLKFVLEINLNNIEIISRCSTSNNTLFTQNLIKIFLSCDKNEIRLVIKDIFEILLNNTNITAINYEFIFQDVVKYFREVNLKIDIKIMDRYLDILKIMYGERLNPAKPKNYFYLSGTGCIRVQNKYFEEEKLKLNNGFVISLWFQLESYPNMEMNNISDLLILKLNRNNTKLQLSVHNNKLFLKSPIQNNEPICKFSDGWNNLSLIIKPAKLLRDTELLIIFKDQTKTIKIADFSCDSEIFEMIFFQNFFGQVSTILFLNKALSEDILKIFKRFNYGFSSEYKLNQLYKIANPSYLINSNYPFKNIKYSQKETDGANIILESLRILYIPSRFRESDFTLYDVTGRYHGSLITYNSLNGNHIYLNLQSNIQYIGGINNLIPIIELCCKIKHNIDTQNCINEEIFINYFEIVYFILNYKKNNMKNALETNFFRIVSIFVEKFSENVFTERILSLLLNIGKSLFSLTHDCNLSMQYFDEILLNEKIITKFSTNLQITLWKNLYQFYVSDISLIKTFMNMKKLLILFRYYDKNKYSSYCCSEHSSQFDLKPDQIVIMDPPLFNVIENLINITQLLVDGTVEENMENIKLLVNVLNLDFSPCIIKGVISIFTNFFRNNKVKEDIKKSVLKELLNEELIEISLFTYSVSLIDVRVEFIKFFQVLSLPAFKEILSFHLDKIIVFLKESAMPDYIKIKAKALEIECPLRERSIGITKKTNSKKSFDIKKLNTNKSLMISSDNPNEESNIENPSSVNSYKRNNVSSMGIIYETKEALTIITERSELNDTPKTVESERKKKLSLQYDQKSLEIIFKEKEDELKKNIAGIAVEKEISIESPINKTPQSKHRTNKDKSLPKRISENMNSLEFDIEIEKENNTEDSVIKLNNIENYSTKPEAFKSRIHKKSISGFSSTRSRKGGFQNIFSPDKIIAIDTDDINKLYKYGGEKHEKNISGAEEKEMFEKSMLDLAKHCIEFMFDEVACVEMKKGEEEIINLEENKAKHIGNKTITSVVSKKSSNLLDNQHNSDSKLLAQPKSVRGLTKINFTGFNINKNIQEEVKEEVKGEAEKKEETKLDFIENYVIIDKPKDLKNELYEDLQMENLEKYFNKNGYKTHVENFYKSLIDWLINKSKKSTVFDETDLIINPFVLDIIIKICSQSDSNFLLKCLEDFYILLLNTKDNSNSIYKNSNFYPFLIETSYKYFLISNESKQTNSSALSIYILGKKIHTDLIISYVGKDDKFKTDSINKFHFLLSWGIYFKNLYNSQKTNLEINDFIRTLIMELITSFKQKLKTYSPSLSFALWENYVAFSILVYEYMVFYNLDKNLKDGSMFTIWSEETIVVPAGILSGLNLQHEKMNENVEKPEKTKEIILLISEIWSDYKIFEANYSILSQIFNKKMFSDDKYSVSKFEKIILDIIFNKKQKDLFAENIKLLFYSFRPNDNIKYNNILVKSISNSFAVIISVLQDEKEIKNWVEEYEKFLIFLIVSTANMNEKDEVLYQKVHDITLDIICFGLSFLIDEYFYNSIKQSNSKKYYYIVIKNVFTLLVLIYDHILEVQSKKKKNLLKVLSKGRNHLYSAVYRIFNEFIVDPKTKEPLINKQKIAEFKQNQFVEIPTILKNEEWRTCLYGNPILKSRMKNLFDFPSYENIIKERYEVIKYYRPIYNLHNSPEEVNRDIEKIRKKLYDSIEYKVSRFENDYMKVQNKKYNDYFEKKFLYKQLKKNLFQWNGFWADKNLYFKDFDKLRLKLKNHYTSYYARPFLSSILDIEYHLPKFTKFDRKRLFLNNSKNLEYNIKLNVEEILEGNKQNDVKKVNPSNPQNKNNFIYEIYKYCNKKVWNLFQEINNLSLDYQTPQYFNIFLTSKKDDENDCIFECCYVKLSHHIKGIFRISKEGIFFKPIKLQYSSNEIENDDDYDKDRKTCYGSSLTFHEKEKDRIVYKWHLTDIKYILKRRYYYKKKAIEVFTYSNKSYLFTFKSQQKRDNALKIIYQILENKREIKIDTKEAKEKEDLIIGIENLLQPKKGSKTLTFSSKIEEWANWKISNFELLMYLNIFGNRSFSDINQYPVFPWIIINFKEDLNFEKDFRDLSVPMGMLEIDSKSIERKERYLEEFKESNFDFSEKQRHYGTHYSNPLTVAHYLTRIFPLTQMHIELQGGGFDNPNRLFFSMESSFSCATSLQGDVRELIPEFYYLPEMFYNINNLDMGKRVDLYQNQSQVENVEVPIWANKNPYIFVSMLKEFLERDEVSYKINEWADLIFGSKQKGKEAENYGNVFEHFTYEDSVNLDIEDRSNYECLMRKAEFGLTPSQLLTKTIPPKLKKEAIKKGKQFTESKELKVFGTPGQKTKSKEKPLMLCMKVLDNERVLCLFNNNTYSIYKFTAADFRYNISIDTKQISNETEFKQYLKDPYFYSETIDSPCLIFCNGKAIAQAGYFDGRISVWSNDGTITKSYTYFTDMNYQIIVLKIDKEEKYVFAGSSNGSVFIYKINEIYWNIHKILFDHSKPITSLSISNTLNAFASSSMDGFVNIYTLPDAKILRSISKNKTPIDNVFLSAFPLPCCVIQSNNILTTYGINGNVILAEVEENDILCPKVFTDRNHIDYIIYGNQLGELKIRKFPQMKIIHKLSMSELKKGINNKALKCLDISEDKKYIYFWQVDDIDITLVKDPSITTEAATVNLINMGFGF